MHVSFITIIVLLVLLVLGGSVGLIAWLIYKNAKKK